MDKVEVEEADVVNVEVVFEAVEEEAITMVETMHIITMVVEIIDLTASTFSI